jgi:predicted NAD/FAD-dependent oxidoreductase
VAVVGAGLAGLTAALHLAKRGFQVTVYEASAVVGGNFSSAKSGGVFQDVYPHMFCAWYANFWGLFGDELGLSRDEHFEPRMGVKLLNKGSAGFVELENATTLKSILANLNSGLMSWPDLFLLGYSMLDLAATPFDRDHSDQLEQLDVNGFVYSRGYSTENVARLQNFILMVIWSIQSEVTAASSYQDFVKHTIAFPHATPFAWMLKGSLYEKIIQPLEQRLWELGCDIRTSTPVRRVELIEGRPKLTVDAPVTKARGTRARQDRSGGDADYVVLATPAPNLAELVLNAPQGARIVDALPHLSELRRLRGEAIPVIDVWFKRRLADIPKEQVALTGSDSVLTMLDISQLWTGMPADRTVLVLAASNGYALASAEAEERGFLMIRTLHDYLPVFTPGERWGDPDSDIDWAKTRFRANDGNKLFVNAVGSWEIRPKAAYADALPRVFFAGDFCQTDVDMATIEAAVQSGLLAAQALQAEDARREGKLRGEPITVARHEVYSDATFLAAKLLCMPFAYAATAWSGLLSTAAGRRQGPLPPKKYSPATYSLLLPLAFTMDWWKTLYWLARRLAAPGGGEDDDEISVGPARALAELGVDAAAAGAEKAHPGFAGALAAFGLQAVRTAQAAATSARGEPAAGHRRAWRVKR